LEHEEDVEITIREVYMMNQSKNEKSPQVAGTTSEVEIRLLLRVIEQGVQSILIRDKYMRVLLIVQTLLMLFILIK
jgi:hypothetical protein